jgi:hypothetical protein
VDYELMARRRQIADQLKRSGQGQRNRGQTLRV